MNATPFADRVEGWLHAGAPPATSDLLVELGRVAAAAEELRAEVRYSAALETPLTLGWLLWLDGFVGRCALALEHLSTSGGGIADALADDRDVRVMRILDYVIDGADPEAVLR